MQVYELKAYLNHLTLAGRNDENEYEWIGTREEWNEVEKEIEDYENND